MWKSKLKNKTKQTKSKLVFKAYISLHKVTTNKTMEHKNRKLHSFKVFIYLFYITRNDFVLSFFFIEVFFATVLSVKLRELNDATDATIKAALY